MDIFYNPQCRYRLKNGGLNFQNNQDLVFQIKRIDSIISSKRANCEANSLNSNDQTSKNNVERIN